MLKSLLCIKWRINVDAFYFANELAFQGFQSQQIITMNQNIVKDVTAC